MFGTLPCELGQNVAYPQDVVAKIASVGSREWRQNEEIVDLLSTASISTFDDFPETVSSLVSIYCEPLITNSGSLTEDRNYESYALGMSNPHIISEKMKDIQPFLPDTRSARIVDEGCADGALLRLISREAPDACLLGVDLSSEFLAMCAERQRRGDFGQSFVHFHQRNLLNQIFEDASIDTTICNSTLHEIWSYGSHNSLRNYLRLKLQQTREGGRLIIGTLSGRRTETCLFGSGSAAMMAPMRTYSNMLHATMQEIKAILKITSTNCQRHHASSDLPLISKHRRTAISI